jgi:hypothetical protein
MASMQTNATMLSLTPSQLATLPPNEQAQYMKGLSPSQQALVAQEVQQASISANRMFMRKSVERTAYCPVTGGSGTSATYAAGTTLYFDLPNVPGFAKGLLITYSLSPTATANSGTFAANAAAPFNIFSELQVLYNGPQIRTHPYFACGVLDQLKGFSTGKQNRVVAGTNDSTIAASIVGTTPLVTGSNTWQGKMFLRLNALGDDTVPGLLPLSGVGNKPQLKLTCATALGNDPLMNPVSAVGGSTPTFTFTGTINVDVVFLDGSTMDTPAPLSLAWQGEPTLQYYWDSPLTPFAGGSIQRQTISTKLQHWYVVSVIIDGQQANQFLSLTSQAGSTSNLTGMTLGPDQVGQQTWLNWNIANNVSVNDYFDRFVRRPHGQDLDNGVIAWIDAPARGVLDADNRNGQQFLNMYPGGFPAATHSYQVGTTASPLTGVTPRVETFLVSVNTAGLKVS